MVCAPESKGVIESFCLTFTAGLPGIGEPVLVPLCQDGEDVAVTADNRREYVEAYADCILNSSIEKQVSPSHCCSSDGCHHLFEQCSTDSFLMECIQLLKQCPWGMYSCCVRSTQNL